MIPLRYRHYHLPPDFPVIAFLGDQWTNPREEISFLHFHDCVEVGYCRKGSGILHIAEHDVFYGAGDLCVIPAYTPHMMQSVCEEESQWEYLFFQPTDMWGQLGKELAEDQRIWGEQGWNTYLFSREAYPQMYDLFQSLLRAFRQKPDLYKVTVRGGLLSLLAQVQREETGAARGETVPQHMKVLFPALRYMDQWYGQKVEISYLASLCALSPTHFRRLFRQVMQASPLEYLNRIRVSMACRRILGTAETMAEIARECGFPTVSGFHRAFQKYVGMTPTEWKQAYSDRAEHNAVSSPDDFDCSFLLP